MCSPRSFAQLCGACFVVLLLFGCGDNLTVASEPDSGQPDALPDPDAPAANVVVCDQPVTPASTGICDVTPGTGSAIALRGMVLAPGDVVYAGGTVLIDGAGITCVGCDCAGEPGHAGATVVECGDAVISPGLINSHDHLRYTEGAPINHGATRYQHRHEWRATLDAPTNQHGTSQTSTGMRWGEMRMAFAGVTSMVGAGRALGMLRNLDDLTTEEVAQGFRELEFETFPLGDSNRTFRSECQWRYRFSERDVDGFPAYLPHVAEGINEYAHEEFRCQSSPFDRGRDHTESNTAHIHGIGLGTADYWRMTRDDAQIIWSPRSNISLYGMTADVVTFDRLGGTIALGTDWNYTGSTNILRELACADSWNRDYLGGHFSDRELWEMVTINAARVTGNSELIGSLEAGKVADIAVFARRGRDQYRAVIEAGNSDVALVLRDGVPLYGEADTLEALGESCEVIDVCGDSRAVCAMREFGTGYATILADAESGTSAYPAVFCDQPANEPTCIPSRPGEYTGDRSDSDSDGDGIANDVDNCPGLFNPVRPIDSGVQPDSDGDGVGDSCDDSPLAVDLDGDGVANDADNCVFDGNADQADGDGDGKGDACDACPGVANPDGRCPPTTIVNARNGDVRPLTYVNIDNVVVTAVASFGAAVQDPNVASPEYSGIWVYTGSNPGVSIGDLVDVSGSVDDYFGLAELNAGDVTAVGTATPIVATDLTVAEAATEPYESVLVHLSDIGPVDASWDCSVDNSACNDQNLWQVTGTGGGSVLVYDRLYEGTDWQMKVGVVPVIGVMGYRFDRRRIQPRVPADFGNQP